MRIYGIEVARVHGKDQPVLRSAEARETGKSYLVESRPGFLGYRTRVDKGQQDLCLTEVDAWETYIERCNRMRVQLRAQCGELTEFQSLAIGHLQELVADQGIKIGGTD